VAGVPDPAERLTHRGAFDALLDEAATQYPLALRRAGALFRGLRRIHPHLRHLFLVRHAGRRAGPRGLLRFLVREAGRGPGESHRDHGDQQTMFHDGVLLFVTLTSRLILREVPPRMRPRASAILFPVRFRNPEGSLPRAAGLAEFAPFFLRRLRDRRPPPVPPGHVVPLPEEKELLRSAGPESLTWLGHASFLLRTGGLTVLTDPFLSDRASPMAGFGPKRFVPPGLPLEELPPIDVVVLSHNHYDHLDARTIEALPGKGHVVAAVPAGLGDFFRRRGSRDVRELRWWEETRIGADFILAALPSNHFSGRTPFDRNATLWASWAIASRTRKVFFAGDTGYGPVFGEIGRRIGPFDLGLVPIGAYEPSSIM